MTAAEGAPFEGAISWAYGPPIGHEVDDGAVSRAVRTALAHGGHRHRRVDVVFVDKGTLASMHGEFLGDPTETDVITFDLGFEGDQGAPGPDDAEGPPPEADAELYVSVDRALEMAVERRVSFERELILYVVHGTLHLCGLDDRSPDDRIAMRAAEKACLELLGYPEDHSPHDSP